MALDRNSLPRLPWSRRLALPCAALMVALLAPSAAASTQPEPLPPPDLRIDQHTGQDMRIWPPDRLFDFERLRLEIDIPDMHEPRIIGRCTITATPIGIDRAQMQLDAGPAITFRGVTVEGSPVAYSHKDSKITIELPRAFAPGERVVVVMDYDALKPGGRGEGLTFSKADPSTPEDDPMCHAQGQPQSNHLWFPCHDFPNDRLATEVIATVPAGFTAISNGRLVEVRKSLSTAGGGDSGGRWRFHWNQDLPHPVYLVTLIVGKFDVVDVGGPDTARPGIWMPVYGPIGSAEVLRRNFKATPEMLAFFEEILDEPFPWDKYANIVCRDFAAGAMENTSAATWASFAATAPAAAVDPINAHEIIHHWFGNMITCNSWEHLWLNEGWATYGEAMWAEHVRGDSAYLRSIARGAAQIRGMARGSRPRSTGMVSNRYRHPDEQFFAPDNVYQKGGWILHCLRSRLGDDIFWSGVRSYIKTHKFGQVETDDFRFALEAASGESLERFFDQFVVRPGLPRLNVDLAWDAAASTLTVGVEQMQKIDADNPAYAFSLPLLVTYSDDDYEYLWIDIDTRSRTQTFELGAKPSKVVVDPRATVPAEARITTDLAMLIEQLRTGPTVYAQMLAAESLAHVHDALAARALASSALAWNTDPLVRGAAARSLSAIAAAETAAAARFAMHQLSRATAVAAAGGGDQE